MWSSYILAGEGHYSRARPARQTDPVLAASGSHEPEDRRPRKGPADFSHLVRDVRPLQTVQASSGRKPSPRTSWVELTLTEFWIVYSLARHPGHVKNRDQLMQDANLVVDEGTITSHIKRIRKKFCIVAGDFDAIDTVYGMGYRWRPGGAP